MIKLIPYFGKASRGFSLVEMSVVLVIIGFIASSAISVAITSDFTTKRDETESKLDRIEEALAGYLSANHRLPCPADGTLAITNTAFGIEGAPTVSGCPVAADPNVSSTAGANFQSSTASPDKIFAGVIPIRTLSLPDDFMFDGWGRRIDYIVHMAFVNNDITNGACAGTAGNICFRDYLDGTITVSDASETARTTTAVYVLLSHGENGHGAFPKPGSTTAGRINGFPAGNPYREATTAAKHEILNAKFTNVPAIATFTANFIMRDYTRVDDGTTSDGTSTSRVYFDDQIRFRTKAQIVKAAGAKIYESICKSAAAIVAGTGTDCASVVDTTQCTSFATSVNDRCLQ